MNQRIAYLILIFLYSFINASLIYGLDIAIVNAPSGANIRSQPNKASDKINVLKSGTEVYLISKSENQDIIDGIASNWYKIRYGDHEGWVFGGLLKFSKAPQMEPKPGLIDAHETIHTPANIDSENSPNRENNGFKYVLNFTIRDINGNSRIAQVASLKVDITTCTSPWAGANEGDLIYKGDFLLNIKSSNGNYIDTGLRLNNYYYNYTQNKIYTINSVQHGFPDFLIIEETESSLSNRSSIYWISDNSLKRITIIDDTNRCNDMYSTSRLRINESNIIIAQSYNPEQGVFFDRCYNFIAERNVLESINSNSQTHIKTVGANSNSNDVIIPSSKSSPEIAAHSTLPNANITKTTKPLSPNISSENSSPENKITPTRIDKDNKDKNIIQSSKYFPVHAGLVAFLLFANFVRRKSNNDINDFCKIWDLNLYFSGFLCSIAIPVLISLAIIYNYDYLYNESKLQLIAIIFLTAFIPFFVFIRNLGLPRYSVAHGVIEFPVYINIPFITKSWAIFPISWESIKTNEIHNYDIQHESHFDKDKYVRYTFVIISGSFGIRKIVFSSDKYASEMRLAFSS